MTASTASSKIASTLTINNVRLPPEAYASLDHVALSQDAQDKLPLVDVEYVHFEPSSSASSDEPSSAHTVEVHLSASIPHPSGSAEVPFDLSAPFQAIARDIAPPPSTVHAASHASRTRQLVSRFSTSTSPPISSSCIDAQGSVSVPGGLCHPHIHLDKCYLLDRCTLSSGTFDEALTSTSSAKARFTPSDLIARMQRLVVSSLSHGVTAMRAFVEVDPTVKLMCLEAAILVKKEFKAKCEVQIVVFAQDAIFYPDDKGKQEEMQKLLEEAAQRKEVDVVGSAPYVEALSKADQEQLEEKSRKRKQKEQQARNIEFIFALAQRHAKHVDFHLDYDLEPPGSKDDGEHSMIPYVVSLSQKQIWTHSNGNTRSVTMGHCTKLSCFDDEHLDQLASCFSSSSSSPAQPPISFVSLPPSDLYMQGRAQPYSSRPRATLPLLELASHPRLKQHTNWAMGVNNVANLFTPQGDADPLALLPMMVGVWQSAKPQDCELMVGAISTKARLAAGLESSYSKDGKNLWADLTVLDGSTSIQELVCSPSFSRVTIKDGKVVARRRVQSEVYDVASLADT